MAAKVVEVTVVDADHSDQADPTTHFVQQENDVFELSPEARAQAHELRHNPRFFTAAELAQHDGVAPDAMLLLAIRSSRSEEAAVLDVSEGGTDFYGPGRAYHVFAGADCSRAFSLSSLAPEHRHGRMDDATEAEWRVLDDWHDKLAAKYPTVGLLMPTQPQLREE